MYIHRILYTTVLFAKTFSSYVNIYNGKHANYTVVEAKSGHLSQNDHRNY